MTVLPVWFRVSTGMFHFSLVLEPVQAKVTSFMSVDSDQMPAPVSLLEGSVQLDPWSFPSRESELSASGCD
jgi:hypothetical protein